jgi:hypothetical protein
MTGVGCGRAPEVLNPKAGQFALRQIAEDIAGQ